MRKPRDYDAELKALNERTAQLKSRKVQQLGELVIASGADALPLEILAGALVTAAKEKEATTREGWRKAGAAFFYRTRGNARGAAASDAAPASNSRSTPPHAGGTSET